VATSSPVELVRETVWVLLPAGGDVPVPDDAVRVHAVPDDKDLDERVQGRHLDVGEPGIRRPDQHDPDAEFVDVGLGTRGGVHGRTAGVERDRVLRHHLNHGPVALDDVVGGEMGVRALHPADRGLGGQRARVMEDDGRDDPAGYVLLVRCRSKRNAHRAPTCGASAQRSYRLTVRAT
jgi:hypothetical protein